MLDQIVKYLLEGLAVAVAAYFIPQKKTKMMDVAYIAIAAAATFAVLDFFAPSVSTSTRFGSGFGVGANLVGFGGAGLEFFEDAGCGAKSGEECKDPCEMKEGKCVQKEAAAPAVKEGFYAEVAKKEEAKKVMEGFNVHAEKKKM
jgi:hypothetical protein